MFHDPNLSPSSPIHAVLVTVGTLGDLHPFLRVARALQARGHRVTLLAPAPHRPHVAQAGIPFHPLGTTEAYAATLADPDLWHPRKAFGVVWRSMSRFLEPVPAFVVSLPPTERCLLVAHPVALPFAALARAARPGTRIVAAYLAPANLRTCHDPLMMGPLRIPTWFPHAWRRWLWDRVDTRMLDPVSLPSLNALRHAQGLPPVRHFVEHMNSVADLSVTFFPEWFAPSQPDWPRPLHRGEFPLYDPAENAPLPKALARFLAAGDAPIVFTPGTGHRHAADYFLEALEAVRRLERRAIFLTPERSQIAAVLPDHVLWQSYAPLRHVLPRAAALVHHGGIGTTAEALRAGVPQLVMPLAHDQFDNGARVQALGVGEVLRGPRVRARRLAATLQALLASDRLHTACRTVAQRLTAEPRMDSLCEAVESAWA